MSVRMRPRSSVASPAFAASDISKVLPDAVELAGGERIPSAATLWTAGVRVSPAVLTSYVKFVARASSSLGNFRAVLLFRCLLASRVTFVQSVVPSRWPTDLSSSAGSSRTVVITDLSSVFEHVAAGGGFQRRHACTTE